MDKLEDVTSYSRASGQTGPAESCKALMCFRGRNPSISFEKSGMYPYILVHPTSNMLRTVIVTEE